MSARIITIPTIDILLEVESLPALDSLNDRMRDMGYTPRGENGIAGRRYYIKGNGKRTHHVHAFIAGSEQADIWRSEIICASIMLFSAIQGNQIPDGRRLPAKSSGLWPVEKRIDSTARAVGAGLVGYRRNPMNHGLDGIIHIPAYRCA
ncbi:GrpB family protein [Serratia nematodiphila]|uniref:GrpB family protein n=1 Tax=Serratia marcescens TaxID=615 RepID=UPI00310177C9